MGAPRKPVEYPDGEMRIPPVGRASQYLKQGESIILDPVETRAVRIIRPGINGVLVPVRGCVALALEAESQSNPRETKLVPFTRDGDGERLKAEGDVIWMLYPSKSFVQGTAGSMHDSAKSPVLDTRWAALPIPSGVTVSVGRGFYYEVAPRGLSGANLIPESAIDDQHPVMPRESGAFEELSHYGPDSTEPHANPNKMRLVIPDTGEPSGVSRKHLELQTDVDGKLTITTTADNSTGIRVWDWEPSKETV